jgi:tetratricopeptide (TPR) repeat protein
MYQEEDQVQTRRRQADVAIQLAMANRWEEAVNANRSIIQLFPNDGDSHNRLGKALMELGKYSDAKKAYNKALALDPTNAIARKNLERLKVLAKSKAAQPSMPQVDPKLFIEEMGKSAVTDVQSPTEQALTTLNAGDRLILRPEGASLRAVTPGGEPVGLIEPKLTSRLIKLLDGGNQYAVAVTSVSNEGLRIIIKETYQHPSMVGRPSFPTTAGVEGMRPYTKGSLLRARLEEADRQDEADDRDPTDDDDSSSEWEDESSLPRGHVRLNDAAAAEDMDDEEIEE